MTASRVSEQIALGRSYSGILSTHECERSPLITETATRVRVALAAACPEADLFRSIAYSQRPPAL
jgi:hypothetical protein